MKTALSLFHPFNMRNPHCRIVQATGISDHSYQSSFLMCCVSWMEKPEGEIIRQDIDDADSTL